MVGSQTRPTNRFVVEPEFQIRLGSKRQWRIIFGGHYFKNTDESGKVYFLRTNSKLDEKQTNSGNEKDFTTFGWGSEWWTIGGGIGFDALCLFNANRYVGELELRFTIEAGQSSGRIATPNGSPPGNYHQGDDPADYPDQMSYFGVGGIKYSF